MIPGAPDTKTHARKLFLREASRPKGTRFVDHYFTGVALGSNGSAASEQTISSPIVRDLVSHQAVCELYPWEERHMRLGNAHLAQGAISRLVGLCFAKLSVQ